MDRLTEEAWLPGRKTTIILPGKTKENVTKTTYIYCYIYEETGEFSTRKTNRNIGEY